MPELPEVETTRQGILPFTQGKRISRVIVREPRLRWPVDPDLNTHLSQNIVRQLSRRGKYLLFQFDHGCLLVHLGMSGSLRIEKASSSPRKHDHVDIVIGQDCLRFHDPRRFGSMVWTEQPPLEHSLLAKLGPEPLSEDFTGDYLFSKSRKRSKAVKEWLMDSHMVVGVGNIYANESLFEAGIHPTKAAGRLSKAQCDDLAAIIKRVLQRSITQGGTTLRDFVGGDGQPGYFKQQLLVYGRGGEACTQCQKPLKEIRQNNRATVYCTRCQR